MEGDYTIYEIKDKYVLAKNNDVKIVLYGIDHPNYKNTYHVSYFDEIHSLKNISLFNFESYMHSKGIYYSANCLDEDLIYLSPSIKSKLFTKFSTSSYKKSVFYGIHDEESPSLFSRLSLPFISLIKMIEELLKKRYSSTNSTFISLCIGLLLGFLFTFTIGYIRFLIFESISLLFDDWKMKYSISNLIFLTLFPSSCLDFVFIFPVGLQFLMHYTKGYYRNIAQIVFSIFCQFYYFHEVDVLFLFFFSFFRQMYAYIALLLFINIEIDIPSLPSFTIHYYPNLVYIGISMYLLYLLMMHVNLKRIGIWVFIFLISIYILPYTSIFFSVYMLDIGQGDCTLIVEPFLKSVVMIDCGGNLYRDNVDDIIVPFLENLHIKKIDTLIITHDDFDHSGCKDKLLDTILVEQVIESSNDVVNVKYPFYSLLEERISKDENDKSVISYFSYDDFNYLWMGDASIDVESQLINQYRLDVDVLKLGHHGSSTSSSYTFLDNLRPKFGLISVGYKNKYGHPSSHVISNCHNLGIQTIETDHDGMIHLFSFRHFLFLETETGYITVYNS